jgi:heat shock protein HtpX
MRNRLKTVALLATLTALAAWVGGAVGGESGMITAFGIAALMNVGAWWWSDRLVLRLYGAREVGHAEIPWLHEIVRRLAARAGIPAPRVYLIPEDAPNAFATGRNPQHGALAVTEGLLRVLDWEELEGVLAHEIGHIRNRDTLISTVAATVAGAIGMLADLARVGALFGAARDDDEEAGETAAPGVGLLAILVAPFVAMVIQLAISRAREYLADETAGRLTGSPLALASALRKIAAWSREMPMTAATPATAHLFIVTPLSGSGWLSLFSTHPSIEDRVARLEAMARTPYRFAIG